MYHMKTRQLLFWCQRISGLENFLLAGLPCDVSDLKHVLQTANRTNISGIKSTCICFFMSKPLVFSKQTLSLRHLMVLTLLQSFNCFAAIQLEITVFRAYFFRSYFIFLSLQNACNWELPCCSDFCIITDNQTFWWWRLESKSWSEAPRETNSEALENAAPHQNSQQRAQKGGWRILLWQAINKHQKALEGPSCPTQSP